MSGVAGQCRVRAVVSPRETLLGRGIGHRRRTPDLIHSLAAGTTRKIGEAREARHPPFISPRREHGPGDAASAVGTRVHSRRRMGAPHAHTSPKGMAGALRLELLYQQNRAGACRSKDGCAEHGCISLWRMGVWNSRVYGVSEANGTRFSRYAALCKRLRAFGRGSIRYRCALGRRLLARGSARPNRSPTSCCAIARSITCSKNSRSAGAARRIASWNAVIVCSVPLKLSCREAAVCIGRLGHHTSDQVVS